MWYMISATSLTGPVHRESSEDIGMDEDDERDFEDLNYQPQEDDATLDTFSMRFRLDSRP